MRFTLRTIKQQRVSKNCVDVVVVYIQIQIIAMQNSASCIN
jgi:hypothetical protein